MTAREWRQIFRIVEGIGQIFKVQLKRDLTLSRMLTLEESGIVVQAMLDVAVQAVEDLDDAKDRLTKAYAGIEGVFGPVLTRKFGLLLEPVEARLLRRSVAPARVDLEGGDELSRRTAMQLRRGEAPHGGPVQ
jgi:hypothetical protein